MLILEYDQSSTRVFSLVEEADWEPVQSWIQESDGKRRPSGQQEQREDGARLWQLPIMLRTLRYGSLSYESSVLQTWATEKPELPL